MGVAAALTRAPGLGPLSLSFGAVLLLFRPLGAQGAVAEAVLEASLTQEAGPVPVTLDYRLLPGPGAREVGLTLLTPGDTRLTTVEASAAGEDLALQLRELRPHYWSGTVTPLPGGDSCTIHVSYTVNEAWSGEGRVTVPIPAVSWIPRDPHPRTFVARVRVPGGLTVTESFPTSVVDRPRGDEGGSYEMALQGVPAFLVLRVVRGEAPFLTLERILDALVVAVLVVMGAAGVRFLKRREG